MSKSDRCFMVDDSMLDKVVEAADLGLNDLVLEVGAGQGNLTRKIAAKSKVSAIEKEADLFGVLEKNLSGDPKVELIHGDVLKIELPMHNKVVSNIPYSISRKLLTRLIIDGFELSSLVVQKEFAQKLLANPFNQNYRMISVLAQSTCDIEYICDISPKAFRPSPNVDSSLIVLRQRIKPKPDYVDFLNRLFSQKNKKVRNIVSAPERFDDLRPGETKPETLFEIYTQSM